MQVGYSLHPWLEDRGPKLRLLIVGDEAVLRASEGTRGYLVLRGRNPTVGHHSGCLRKLGIQQIYALSPQAKRRVDRMLGTFQGTGW